jgi:hypothetical protein
MKQITKDEFDKGAKDAVCRSVSDEYKLALSPTFWRYTISSKEFLSRKVYPTWRTNHDGTKYIGRCETDRTEAFAITYQLLKSKQSVLDALGFHSSYDSFAGDAATKPFIVYHCRRCGVYVVKDGNHRVLRCEIHRIDRQFDIYQVSSDDWSCATIDMKNFCDCQCFGPLPLAR